MHSAVQAFKAAVVSVGNEDADPSLTYAVEGSASESVIKSSCSQLDEINISLSKVCQSSYKCQLRHLCASGCCTWVFCSFSVFNAIVRLCMTDILPTVNRILKLPSKSKDPNKPVLPQSSKYWSKVRGDMKTYLADIIQVLPEEF